MNDKQATAKPEITVIPADAKIEKPIPRRQLRVAAYCRVSTDNAEQLTSYEAQKAYYTDKIMTNTEWAMAGIFADEGISGLQAKKRPQFQKMIRMCERGKIDLILTKSISRFARNTVDCLNYIRMLKQMNIGVIFENENINTLTSDSEVIITMLGGFAQAESESISRNVKWGRRQAMKQGKVSFQFKRMYGYERGEDARPRVVPEQAAVVRRIFESYLEGKSVSAIQQKLKDDGILTGSDKEVWSTGALQYMLRNEKYCGDVLQQKTFIEDCISKKAVKNNGQLPKYLIQNHHEPIVDRETFYKVQAEIARRGAMRRCSPKTGDIESIKYCGKYALTDLLICGECGTPYKRVTWSKNGKKKIVWRCISRLDYGTKYCKQSPTIEEGRLQEVILKAIIAKIQDSGSPVPAHSERRQPMKISNEANPVLVNRINELLPTVMELVAVAADTGDFGSYDGKLKELSDEITLLQEQFTLHQTQQNSSYDMTLPDISGEIEAWDDTLVRQLIDTITIVSTDKILVVFKDQTEIEQGM